MINKFIALNIDYLISVPSGGLGGEGLVLPAFGSSGSLVPNVVIASSSRREDNTKLTGCGGGFLQFDSYVPNCAGQTYVERTVWNILPPFNTSYIQAMRYGVMIVSMKCAGVSPSSDNWRHKKQTN